MIAESRETESDSPPIFRLNVGAAAASAGFSRQRVISLIDRGALSHAQLPGGRKMIDPGELRELIGPSGVAGRSANHAEEGK